MTYFGGYLAFLAAVGGVILAIVWLVRRLTR